MRNLINRITGKKFQDARDIQPENSVIRDLAFDDELNSLQILIGARKGVYLIDKGRLIHLLAGHTYGISEWQDRWYAHQRGKRGDRIVSFDLRDGQMEDPRVEITDLSPGCHQIDFIGDELYITETYKNRILIYTNESGKMVRKKIWYPKGVLKKGRESDNYVHMNSVWSDGNHVYVLFHNETVKTGRQSEYVILDDNGRVVQTFSTPYQNAHNFIKLGDQHFICDSMNSSLSVNGSPVYQLGMLTKGLAITDQFILVGGSEFAQRQDRDIKGGALHILDRNFDLLCAVDFPASISEVRVCNAVDFGRSNAVYSLDTDGQRNS